MNVFARHRGLVVVRCGRSPLVAAAVMSVVSGSAGEHQRGPGVGADRGRRGVDRHQVGWDRGCVVERGLVRFLPDRAVSAS